MTTQIWEGFAPVGPTLNIRDTITDYSPRNGVNPWVNPNGEEVCWWDGSQPGVSVRPSNCGGAGCADIELCACGEDCGGSDCEPLACVIPKPEAVKFEPFWVYAQHECCSPVGVDTALDYQRLIETLEATGWSQIARRFHIELQNYATDITGATPSTLVEGIATLLRARGVLGLSGGTLVVPYYALPAIQSSGLASLTPSGNLIGPAGVQVLTDPGLPVTGPGGSAPPAGSSYIYVIDQPPVAAFRPLADTGSPDSFDINNPRHRRLFMDDCGACFQPMVRRQAITAFNTCAAFAIAVDVSGCDCPPCGPPAEEGKAAEDVKGKAVER